MIDESRRKQLDIYNSSIETASIKSTEEEIARKESSISERRKKYAEDYTVLIQSLINTMVMEFNTMFPGAEGFIEGRIKSNNSIALKLKNKFQKAMNEKNLEKMTEAIEKVDLTDILACSVVVTVPPKRFRTTNDKLNEKLNDLAKEFAVTENRIKEHREYIEDNEKKLSKLNEEINDLKQRRSDINKNGVSEKKKELFEQILIDNKEEKDKLYQALASLEIQGLQEEVISKKAQKIVTEENIKYGQENLSRTTDTYKKELLEIQREMAYYFVSNLSTCQSFRILNTSQIEPPDMKNKPGFVASCAKYSLMFTNMETKEKYEITFEIQGKGKEDWKQAEFGKGALYHENQKTDEGQYSKQTYLPDFTIIGRINTDEIEKDTRNKYSRLDFRELVKRSKKDKDLEQWYKENENIDPELINSELENLKKYIKKVQDQKESIEKNSEEYEKYREILEKTTESKINNAYITAKEHIIQAEIEAEINARIDKKADDINFISRINEKDSEIASIYASELDELNKITKTKGSLSDEELKHRARVNTLYRLKEKEIREITKDIVPIYFLANISNEKNKNSAVSYHSTGEAIYRYYYNRFNGLKKGDSYEENIGPQEQQKKALMKLEGLFKEDDANFFIYDTRRKTRIDLNELLKEKEEESR